MTKEEQQNFRDGVAQFLKGNQQHGTIHDFFGWAAWDQLPQEKREPLGREFREAVERNQFPGIRLSQAMQEGELVARKNNRNHLMYEQANV